jgi:hypothetical protein
MVILTQENLSEAQLHSAIDPTGYQLVSVTVEPYEKKGLFGLGKK